MALTFTAGMLAPVNPCGFALLPAWITHTLGDTGTDPLAVRTGRALRSGAALTLGFAGTLSAAGLAISAGARAHHRRTRDRRPNPHPRVHDERTAAGHTHRTVSSRHIAMPDRQRPSIGGYVVDVARPGACSRRAIRGGGRREGLGDRLVVLLDQNLCTP